MATSKRVASDAGKALRSKKTPKKEKEFAGSALEQAKRRKKGQSKKK
jgi:hypothetical protein